MGIQLYKGDIPEGLALEGPLAIDTEATGLNFDRDRLCLIQLYNGHGDVHMVQFENGKYEAPNLKSVLKSEREVKIFHYARFDTAMIYRYLGVMVQNVYCTKIASKVARTYSNMHGLKDICRELLSVNISKQQQSSYWGANSLTKDQLEYAAGDVKYLHKLKDILDEMLKRENRIGIAYDCFQFIKLMVMLDVNGWNMHDVFSYKSEN